MSKEDRAVRIVAIETDLKSLSLDAYMLRAKLQRELARLVFAA